MTGRENDGGQKSRDPKHAKHDGNLHFIFITHFLLISHAHSCGSLTFTGLLYRLVADFAWRECISGLAQSEAQTVLLSNDIINSVTIFLTVLNTLSELPLLWGMHIFQDIYTMSLLVLAGMPSLSLHPCSSLIGCSGFARAVGTLEELPPRLLQVAVLLRQVTI